jgi:hypothetical protein
MGWQTEEVNDEGGKESVLRGFSLRFFSPSFSEFLYHHSIAMALWLVLEYRC